MQQTFNNKVCLLVLVFFLIFWDCAVHILELVAWSWAVVVRSGAVLTVHSPESPSGGRSGGQRRLLHGQVHCPLLMRSVDAAVPNVVSRLGREELP